MEINVAIRKCSKSKSMEHKIITACMLEQAFYHFPCYIFSSFPLLVKRSAVLDLIQIGVFPRREYSAFFLCHKITDYVYAHPSLPLSLVWSVVFSAMTDLVGDNIHTTLVMIHLRCVYTL